MNLPSVQGWAMVVVIQGFPAAPTPRISQILNHSFDAERNDS